MASKDHLCLDRTQDQSGEGKHDDRYADFSVFRQI